MAISGLQQMRLLTLTALIALCVWAPRAVADPPDQLPRLGDGISAIVSPETERRLGQAFLRSLRAQAPTSSDPELKAFSEHLIYQLARHSELYDKRLDVVLIETADLNAFAAPGGIVGINLGLYLNAMSVHEFAGVLAHELAHLSQRHFARGIEEQRKQQIPYLAALLASVAVMATVGGDAGMAALSSTQAVAQSNALRYSRIRETEADRIGINTLARADFDPEGMAAMFERMHQAARFQRKPPEFLLTHPLTERRIADSRNQAASFKRKDYPAFSPRTRPRKPRRCSKPSSSVKLHRFRRQAATVSRSRSRAPDGRTKACSPWRLYWRTTPSASPTSSPRRSS
jgi:predicted Zn-dependent protease